MKKKRMKRACFGIGGILLLVCLLLGAIVFFGIEKPTHIREFSKTKYDRWNKVNLEGDVKSADGSKYYALTKRGTENNWIIYFSGGGMNWDEASTATPISLSTMLKGEELTYFATIPFYKLNTMKGILEEDKEKNPFRDWNYLYIPYSTGDFHIGNNSIAYEKGGKQYRSFHNGRNNVLAAIDWFQKNAGSPDKIFVCGESAGGFGAAFWVPTIAKLQPRAKVYEYTDSSYIQTERWKEILDSYWNADVETYFGIKPETDLITGVIQQNAKAYPEITFLQSNTRYDGMLIDFQKRLNGTTLSDLEYKESWSGNMLSSAAQLANQFSNYHYFITEYGFNQKDGTTPHTLSVADSFYQAREDGTSLCDWLYKAVEADEARNLVSDDIKAQELP